jgi:hypothetical protein
LSVVIAGMTFGFSALGTGYRVIDAKFNASSHFEEKGFGLWSFCCRDLAPIASGWAAKDYRAVKTAQNYINELNQ